MTSSFRRHVITYTNADVMSIGTQGTNFDFSSLRQSNLGQAAENVFRNVAMICRYYKTTKYKW